MYLDPTAFLDWMVSREQTHLMLAPNRRILEFATTAPLDHLVLLVLLVDLVHEE